MKATVGDLLEILETIAPAELAEEWDNSGLQVGARHWPVKKIRVALDPQPEVVVSACRENADLLVTHHPLIFRPLRRVDAATPVGRAVEAALAHKMAVVAVHTNLDIARGGLNDLLAERIGLENISSLDTHAEKRPGLGRIGNLPLPVSLSDLVRQIKERMGLSTVRMAGDTSLAVSRVAVCTGSGGSLMSAFFASEAQVFVSGDLRYHDAREAENAGRALVDIGHFGSEHLMVGALAERLREAIQRRGFSAAVEECRTEQDPFRRL
jgi:dinuclear metal center YbgI/SA1388 family protein